MLTYDTLLTESSARGCSAFQTTPDQSASPYHNFCCVQDALKFPLVGSAVLFSLFLVFKVLPKHLVNLVLAGYFALLGVLALTATALPFLEAICSPRLKKWSWTAPKLKLPSWISKASLAVNPSYTLPG